MKKIISKIINEEFGFEVDSIDEIINLGLVNRVFDVKANGLHLIVRINEDSGKEYEFWKEKWCIEKSMSLGIPGPEVLLIKTYDSLLFMILKKVDGNNGNLCKADEKLIIWRRLGEFASVFHDVKRIDDLHIPSDEFHEDWKAKLEYNLGQLSESDSLLKKEIFDLNEHKEVRERISNLKLKSFEVGLVHGDLSPRNVIWNNTRVTLLDWGSAKIDIVPHAEIGIVQSHNHLEGGFFEAFLQGLQISTTKLSNIKEDILEINLLNTLDLYRWAEGSNFQEIDHYGEKLRQTFEKIKK